MQIGTYNIFFIDKTKLLSIGAPNDREANGEQVFAGTQQWIQTRTIM